MKLYVAELALEDYQPKLNTNFTIPKSKHSNGIQKSKAIIGPFKLIPSSSTRQHLDSETNIKIHQSADSLELETKIAIQVKKEKTSTTKTTNFYNQFELCALSLY